MAREYKSPQVQRSAQGQVLEHLINMNDVDANDNPQFVGFGEFLVEKRNGRIHYWSEGMAQRSDLVELYDESLHGPIVRGKRLDGEDTRLGLQEVAAANEIIVARHPNSRPLSSFDERILSSRQSGG